MEDSHPVAHKIKEIGMQQGLGAAGILLAMFLAAVALFTRDPSLFTHAQFWAEDGKVFYAQAWNLGWAHSLLIPFAGYLNTVQRLGAGLAVATSLRHAPLAMMCWGLFIQLLPVPILLSARCRNFAPLPLRILFAAIYVGFPSAYEIHVTCTSSQWHLIVAEMLLAFADPPRRTTGKAFDAAIFTLGGVSSPFVFVLLPLLLVYWYLRRHRWGLIQASLLAAGCIAQLIDVHIHHQARIKPILGASGSLFARIVGRNVFLDSVLGPHPYGDHWSLGICICALLVGTAICVYSAHMGSLEMRMFYAFCAILLVVSLLKPVVDPPTLAWPVMVAQRSSRYWFLPGLTLLFAIAHCAFRARILTVRVVAIVLTAALFFGIIRCWFIPPLRDLQFRRYVAVYNSAPRGSIVSIPINPPPNWQMRLVRR